MRIQETDEVEFNGEKTRGFRELEDIDPDDCVVHETVAGERLEHLAYQYYGDVSKWYLIADANIEKIKDPMKKLKGGMRLLVPQI